MGLLVVSLFAAAIIFRKQLANLPMIRWFALQPPKMDKELLEKEQQEEGLRALIGWYGTTVSRCNPSGKAMIGDRIYGVVSSTTWLDEDTEIEVESVHENALIVKPRVG
jgi:membrane-bound ClpP family serine protease